MDKLTSFFKEESFPLPDGFSEKSDLYSEVPRLFTDNFYLFYVKNLGKMGVFTYVLSLQRSLNLLKMSEHHDREQMDGAAPMSRESGSISQGTTE